jgi:Flavodoxin domain
VLEKVPRVTFSDSVTEVGPDLMTGHSGIFAGGDMVPSERTVTVAIGHGKKAARNIDAYLRGGHYAAPGKHQLAGFGGLNTWYYADAPATVRPTLEAARRSPRKGSGPGQHDGRESEKDQEVTTMRAVVVYESMYGNTRLIADAIAVGLRSAFDVTIVPVSQASPAVLADADLVVVGGPTHAHGMSRPSTRKAAAEAASKPVSPLTVEPDALGPGLREWFGSLGRYPVKAAAFDTRIHGPAALTGRASKGITRLLHAYGFDVAAEPESFLVTRRDRLVRHELTRARGWGTNLVADIAPSARTMRRPGT